MNIDPTTITTREQARDAAITWQHNLNNTNPSWADIVDATEAFETLGARFDLTDEYRENGII